MPDSDAGPGSDAGFMSDAGPLPLEPMGVVGIVRDPSGAPLSNGTVFLVPAADVTALAATPIDLTLSPTDTAALAVDEPLEDSIDAHVDTYTHATVGPGGIYRIPTIAAGSYFVVFRPDATDLLHLPGGDHCRQASDAASLTNTQLDIKVSGRQSDGATYVGSTACLNCHGRHRSFRTAHRVGLGVPGVRGPYQDTRAWPTFDDGLDAFDRGATLFYYDCDGARPGNSKCKISETDPTIATPTAVISFELQLSRNAAVARTAVGAYRVQFVNRRGAGTASYDVALTYGGAVYKQRFLTRRANADGSLSYFILPIQYNFEGSTTYPSSDDWPWRDYKSDVWYDFTTLTLATPGNQRAFDNNCAGCHFTGFRLTGDATAGFSAHALGDPNGDFDFDGDGRREEINTGCEGCHGPGSEHIESSVRGTRMVSPNLLTPERELMVCGRCHSRPLGIGAGATETPLSSDGQMARPGIRRSEFVAGFTTRVDGAASDFHASGDSKSHHQQYTDFIRSTMYRNGSVLLTCSTCHDAHGNDANDHDLRIASTDNRACTTCHNGAIYSAPGTGSPLEHVTARTGTPNHIAVEASDLQCTRCHMVRTVASGARRPELVDRTPASSAVVSYFHGDIASHRFRVPLRAVAPVQPAAVTYTCATGGSCHGGFLPNP